MLGLNALLRCSKKPLPHETRRVLFDFSKPFWRGFQLQKNGDPQYLQIGRWITRGIRHHALTPGSRLPSTVDLALHLDVGVETVRVAYRYVKDSHLAYWSGQTLVVGTPKPKRVVPNWVRDIVLDRTQVNRIAPQVAAQIRKLVFQGIIPAQTGLLTVTELAKELKLPRPQTIVHAYNELEEQHFIKRAGSFRHRTVTVQARESWIVWLVERTRKIIREWENIGFAPAEVRSCLLTPFPTTERSARMPEILRHDSSNFLGSITPLERHEHHGSRPKFVADFLEQAIRDGRLPPGTALPSLDQLATAFAVHETRVIEAIRRLTAKKLLETRGRYFVRGSYLSPTDLEKLGVPFQAKRRRDDYTLPIVESLKRLIITGKIAPGTVLPSGPAISKVYERYRSMFWRAYTFLHAAGFVEKIGEGRGQMVVVRQPFAWRSRFFQQGANLRREYILEGMSDQLINEVFGAALAASRRLPELT